MEQPITAHKAGHDQRAHRRGRRRRHQRRRHLHDRRRRLRLGVVRPLSGGRGRRSFRTTRVVAPASAVPSPAMTRPAARTVGRLRRGRERGPRSAGRTGDRGELRRGHRRCGVLRGAGSGVGRVVRGGGGRLRVTVAAPGRTAPGAGSAGAGAAWAVAGGDGTTETTAPSAVIASSWIVNWPPATVTGVPTLSAACRSASQAAARLGVPSRRTEVSGNRSLRRSSTPVSRAPSTPASSCTAPGPFPDTSLLLDGTPAGAAGWDDDLRSALPVGVPVSLAGGQFTVVLQDVTAHGAVVRVVPTPPATAPGPGGPLRPPTVPRQVLSGLAPRPAPRLPRLRQCRLRTRSPPPRCPSSRSCRPRRPSSSAAADTRCRARPRGGRGRCAAGRRDAARRPPGAQVGAARPLSAGRSYSEPEVTPRRRRSCR